MRTAREIMDKKKDYRKAIEKKLSREDCDKLWQKATARLGNYLKKYDSLPEGVHTYTDGSIFPAASLYLSAKEFMSDKEAYDVVEDAAVMICAKPGKALKKAMKLPFMPGLFIKMWEPMTKKSFGPSCGFKNRFYPKEKGAYRMDILECPYRKYFAELGCPELTKIFCENDERLYGDLPGLVFERTGTLGKGADRCDFYLHKV